MINLLPPSYKEGFVYARRNTMLLKWAVIILGVTAGLGVFLLAGHFYIANAITDYQSQVNGTKASLTTQKLDETTSRLQNLSANMKLVVQVLSKEVLFSELLKQIGSVMPDKAVLSTIDISKVQGGIDLTAYAQDYVTATQIQVNLQDPSNKLFDKVDIVSVTCGGSTKAAYPCTVTLRAAFTKNNPFLFINKSKAGA